MRRTNNFEGPDRKGRATLNTEILEPEGVVPANRLLGDAYSEDADPALAPAEHDAEEEAAAEVADEGGQAPDDTLGLYLRQMGAIPLLSRKEELELAQALEVARSRFAHATLCSWKILGKVVE